MEELRIESPEGMEWYVENGVIKFREVKEKQETYEDVAKHLFLNKEAFYIGNYAIINTWISKSDKDTLYENICTTKKQSEKLLAINKLMNVAKYLNDGWTFTGSGSELGYYLSSGESGEIGIQSNRFGFFSVVYFKSEIGAKVAIDILGKEVINLALSTNW